MKYMKEKSEVELALQDVEILMKKLGISIEMCVGGLTVSYCDTDYDIFDIESSCGVSSLPRSIESEKLVISE